MKTKKIGNYPINMFISENLAKEFNWIDFNLSCGRLNCTNSAMLRIIASYEDYKSKGYSYKDFKESLLKEV